MSEPSPNVMLGRAVRAIREERGISQVQLAEATGFDQPWISRLESGAQSPTWQTVVRLAEGLEVKVAELAGRAEARAEALRRS